MAKFESVGSDKFHTRLNGELLPTPDGAKLMAMIGMGSFTVTSEVLPEKRDETIVTICLYCRSSLSNALIDQMGIMTYQDTCLFPGPQGTSNMKKE